MTFVDTPASQLLQSFGATSSQSVAAFFGTQDAANEIQQDYAALFRGYLQGTDSSKAADVAGLIDLSQNAVQPLSAIPEDFALTLNPAEVSTLQSIPLETLFAGQNSVTLINQATGEEYELTPEQFGAFNLAVDYRAVQPLELSPESLRALQTTLPKGTVEIQTANVPVQAPASYTAAQGTHLLPSQELLYLFGESAELPAGLTGDAKGFILDGTPATASSLSSTGTAATPAELAAATLPTTATTTGEALGASLTGRDQTLENGLFQATARELQKSTEIGNNAVLTAVVEDGDADEIEGQLLSVTQKPANRQNAALQNAALQSATPNAAAQTAETPQAAAAAATQGAARTALPDGKRSLDADKQTPIKASETPTPVAAKTEAPVITPPARTSVDWTSPWTTPERAAGWSETLAGGLISSGLGGLTGQHNPLGGFGLLGGRPDPLLGQQVAKQLNVNVTRAVKAGENQFSIRLDPAELGRVTVKIAFSQNGLVKSQIIAERPETLELLQRDARGLERALESGGHKAEPGSISFSLDSGGEESAGKAFAEALQEDRLKEQQQKDLAARGETAELIDEIEEEEIDLDEILAHVTPETGLDVRV